MGTVGCLFYGELGWFSVKSQRNYYREESGLGTGKRLTYVK